MDVVDTAIQRLESESQHVVPDMSWIATKTRLHGLMTSVSEELNDVPLYYTLPDLCHTLHCECPPLVPVKAALVNAGYKVSAYHKEPQALKTDAPSRVVWDIMRAWCKEHPPKEGRKKSKNDEHDAGKKILAVEPSITVDFTVPEGFDQKKKATRYPVNPEKNWGPKPRASGGHSNPKKRKAGEVQESS